MFIEQHVCGKIELQVEPHSVQGTLQTYLNLLNLNETTSHTPDNLILLT